MTPQRWQQIEALFAEAVALAPEARTALLKQRCRDDASLLNHVEALLNTYETAPGYMEEPLLSAKDTLGQEADRLTDMAGEYLGPYRLIRPIGKGGMGQVYLAVRDDDQFKQSVAVKLIKRGMDTDEILRRFRMERQILASLDHPNIAQVLDGGMAHDTPYFVMRYIEGTPIDRYCDQNRLPVKERLALFLKVCEAVHYAHQNLIVHRDLKPNNILVTPKGDPVLLDFGIAKVLNQDLSMPSLAITRTELRLMTPDYASPEQVQGRPITTASDVYTLGVLLYQLLSGHRPFYLKDKSFAEIEQIIGHEEPERPSQAVTRPLERTQEDGTLFTLRASSISRARSSNADRLRRTLRGDLDNIVLMALRKEPRRRYASVEQLAQDIRNYQSGLPIIARKDTLGYRTRKFVQRHRLGLSGIAAVGLLLVGFSVVTVMQAREVKREHDKAQQISSFLIELFKSSDPSESLDVATSARAFLDAGAMRVEQELDQQPDIRTTLHQVMSHAYTSLGLFEDAEQQARLSLASSIALDPADPLAEAAALMALGDALFYQARFEQAESTYRDALEKRRALLGTVHQDVAESQHALARTIGAIGDYTTAETLMRNALDVRLNLLGTQHLDVAESQNDLGQLLQFKGEYQPALALLRTSLTTRRALLGRNHPDVGESLDDLALVLGQTGDYETAAERYQESLNIRRQLFSGDHLDVAESLYNLARTSHAQGNLTRADSLMQQALDMDRKLLGTDHPYVANCQYNLGLIRYDQHRYAEAETLHRQALTTYRNTLTHDHPFISHALIGLSQALLTTNNTTLVQPLIEEALSIRKAAYGPGNWYLAEAQGLQGAYLSQNRAFSEAEPLLVSSFETLTRTLGTKHRSTQHVLQYLVRHYEQQNRADQAEPYRALLE